MKKVLSTILAAMMLITSVFASATAFAVTVPDLKLGKKASVTLSANGTTDKPTTIATFTPDKTGFYTFEFDTKYTNIPGTSTADEIPGGAASAEYTDKDGDTATQGMCMFLDFSNADQKVIDAYKALGLDVEHANTIKFTAKLSAKEKYEVAAYQDGGKDFTSGLTVTRHTHTYKKGLVDKVKVKKNGTSDPGGIYDKCTDWYCLYENYTTIYKGIESTSVKNAVYTGKAVKPAVTITTYDGKKLNKKYYTVSYKNNKKIGTGKAIIKFKNGYVGTVTKKFKINPKKTAIKTLKGSKKKLRVTYKKVANVSGYQVQVATNKKFTKNKKTVTLKGSKKTAATVKKLKKNKKYFVRVRTYKVVNKKKYYSKWTAVKAVKVK